MSCFYLLIFYLILNLNLAFAVCRYVKLINCPLPEYPTLTTYFKKKTLFHSTREIRLTMIVSSSTLTLIFLKHHICTCVIHILSCFVFLVCRAFLTWASGSEDCANTSHDSTLNKLFWLYSILKKIKENESVKAKKRKHRTSSTRM